MFTIIGKTDLDFIGKRKYAFVLSSILIVLGVIAFVMVMTGSANMGIDFAGGVMVQGHFEKPVHIDELRAALSGQFSDAVINEVKDFTMPNAFIIKTKSPADEAEAKGRLALINSTIASSFPGNTFTRVSEHVIGPAVGESLRKDAIKAVLVSLLGILIYIAFRFDFRAGVAATIATFHDVLAVMGIFWVLGKEFDLLFVTALLTLAGYSLTDTVVVYDRIRENLKKHRTRAEFVPSVNLSINEVLSRTINTSMTVMVVVVILFFFGGEVLRNFSLAMIIGVLVGTYSSWYVASPIIVEWEARSPKRFK
jgi:preprotein translocase subunit SecF